MADRSPWRMMTGGVALAATIAMAACGNTQPIQIDDHEVLAQLRAVVDGQRVCGTLVSATWPIEFSADALAVPSIDALVSAGIVTRSPVPVPGGERQRVRLLPTAASKDDVLLSKLDEASPPQPKLCFGKKRVEAVTAQPGDTSDQRFRYTYRIVDAPAWTGRADIRAAFPFLDRLLAEPVAATNTVAIRNGKPDLSVKKDEVDDAGLGTHGFFPCPVPDNEPDSPCR